MITQIKYPSRAKGLMLAVFFSILTHAVVVLAIRVAPVIRIAMGFREFEYVEEDYNRAILIDFNKRLQYPSGYSGFRAPKKAASLDDAKKEEERLRRREERRKREREAAEKRAAEKRAAEELAAEERAKSEAKDIAKAEPTPTPTPRNDGYSSFGKINTAPIKDQIQRLYQAKKDGKLRIPDGKFKVGVSGTINPDGTLAEYRVHIPSGIPEIDRSEERRVGQGGRRRW